MALNFVANQLREWELTYIWTGVSEEDQELFLNQSLKDVLFIEKALEYMLHVIHFLHFYYLMVTYFYNPFPSVLYRFREILRDVHEIRS